MLERKRGDVLERHHWCCGGEPVGKGWEPAQVRARVFAMPVATMVAWLDASTELADETPGLWTPTGVLCAECHRGQLEGLLTAPGGRWRVRCEVGVEWGSSCLATCYKTLYQWLYMVAT